MTGPNRFTFDIVANDRASEPTSKVTSNVQALTPALNAAAEAYERMAGAQRKVGVTGNSGQLAQMRMVSREQVNQERTERRLAEAQARRAAQENADAQRRASLVATSAAREAAAYRQISEAIEKAKGAQARLSASTQAGVQARIAALNQELSRTQALVVARSQEVTAASRVAEVARRAVSTGTGSLGTGAGDSRGAAAAASALQQATRGLTAAQQANSAAARQLATEQSKLDSINRQLANSTAVTEQQYNSTRYALYQVAAAYTAIGRVAIGAGVNLAKTAIDFQAAFAQVTRTTALGEDVRQGVEGAAESVDILRNQFVALSTQIPKSFQDLTLIGSLGAQLGIAKADILDFTSVVAKFSATTNVSTEQAAQEFGRLGNLLDVPASKFQNLASSVSYLGTTSVATESEILAVAAQVGAVGTNAGLSAPYVVGLSTALASLRVAPELARGATTRIFSNITRSVAEGGDKLDAFAKVLGTTSAAAATLFQQNPEKFFTDLVTSLGQSSDNGQNLTLILDSLGIKASRDVQVITRLANSYQLLGDYTGKAFESFTKGTYLDTSFQDIAVTTQAALTEMLNSFSAFKDSVGSAFLGPIKLAADVLNGFFQLLTKIPTGITGAFAGVLIAVGVLAAFRAASALAGAALLAFRTAGQALGTSSLSLISVLRLVNQAQTQVTVGATAAAAATRAQTVAFGGSTATILGAAGATTTLAGTQAAATATTGALATGFRTLLTALGPVGLAFIAIGAITGIIGGIVSSSNDAARAAEEAKQAQDALNQSWIQSGNGADALQKAIREDTKAYNEAQAAGQGAGDAFKVITQSTQELADGSKAAVTSISDLRTGLTEVENKTLPAADGFAGYTAAMADATGQSVPTAAGVDNITTALQNNTVAVGESTKEWVKAALFDKLSTLFSGNDMQKALQQLEAIKPGILKDAITAGLAGGPEAVAQSFKSTTDEIKAQMDALESAVAKRENEIRSAGRGALFADGGELEKNKAKLAELAAQYGLLAQLQQQFRDADTAVEQAAAYGQLQAAISGSLGIVTDDFEETGDAAITAADRIRGVQDAYAGLVDDIFASNDLQGGLVAAFDALGQSIADNGTDFTNFTDAGRSNLAALQDAVTAFAATQDDAIKNQGLSAADAAANTAAFIQDTMAELSNQGVDTSQLDFLNQYLAQLTGAEYRVVVNSDTSAAIANVNNLIGALIQARQLSFDQTKYRNTADAAAHQAPVTVKRPTIGAPKQVRASVSPSKLSGALSGGRAAQEAKNLEKANKSAGGAAKKAGKAQKDAADQASESLKKQQEYVRDLGGYYEKLASKAFESVTNQGKAFQSLQHLGQSLTENGKSFNNVTENGRKNFGALIDVFDSFGSTLSTQLDQGAISAGEAESKYREFARGVYGELQSLGVPTQQLTGFFRALGVDATGWTGNSEDVQQYGGFITAAANAVGGLNAKLDLAAQYAEDLGKALGEAFDRTYGLESAADTVAASLNKLRAAYQDNIDKVKELRDENQGLSADLSSAQVEKRKAEIEQGISLKYGETDRAADYGAQAQKAQSTIDTTAGKIASNATDIKTLEAARGALQGNSDAAIENRAALRDLQKQMLDQIEAYAATGATTEEVTRYSEELRAKFVEVAAQTGYTASDVARYTGVFQTYIGVIRTVPDRITTQVGVNGVAEAINALNAIPRSAEFRMNTGINNYGDTLYALSQIPKAGDYKVTPKTEMGNLGGGSGVGGVNSVLNELTRPRQVEISPKVPTGLIPGFSLYRSAVANLGGLIGNQKVTRGFASGGFVPGTPPRDPRIDNLTVNGPGGKFGLRSGEYVIQQPAVKKVGVPFLDALNNGELPGFMRGGLVGGLGGSGGGTAVVELSPDDRALIARSRGGSGTTLLLDGMVLAKSTDKKNAQLARNGTG